MKGNFKMIKKKAKNLLLTLCNSLLYHHNMERFNYYYDICWRKKAWVYHKQNFINDDWNINNALCGIQMNKEIPRMRQLYKDVDWLYEHAKRLKKILLEIK